MRTCIYRSKTYERRFVFLSDTKISPKIHKYSFRANLLLSPSLNTHPYYRLIYGLRKFSLISLGLSLYWTLLNAYKNRNFHPRIQSQQIKAVTWSRLRRGKLNTMSGLNVYSACIYLNSICVPTCVKVAKKENQFVCGSVGIYSSFPYMTIGTITNICYHSCAVICKGWHDPPFVIATRKNSNWDKI